MSAFLDEEAERIVSDYHQKARQVYEAQHPGAVVQFTEWQRWRDAWIKQAMAGEIFRLRNPELTQSAAKQIIDREDI
jgi:hypothetical protein